MKKLLIGSVLSLFVLTGLVTMSFTFINKSEGKVENRQEDLHWFQVNAEREPDQPLTQADVTYIGQSPTPPSGTGCGGSEYQCVSGLTDDQVNSSNQIIGSQMPENVASLKN